MRWVAGRPKSSNPGIQRRTIADKLAICGHHDCSGTARKCNRVVYSGLCGRSCGTVSEHGRCWHGTADQRRIGVETAMKEMRDSCETTAVSRSRPVIALGPPLCSHRCFPESSGGPRRIRGPGKIVQGPRAVDCSGYPHQWPPTVGIPPSGDRRIW